MIDFAAELECARALLLILEDRAARDAKRPVRGLVREAIQQSRASLEDAIACETGHESRDSAPPAPCPRCNGRGRVSWISPGARVEGPCGMCAAHGVTERRAP